MQEYVCGFLFSRDRSRVLLIRKRRPPWQAGRLNGVGGKVEPGEAVAPAMRREFAEEAGLDLAWRRGVMLTGRDWRGHFFRAFGEVEAARAMTDEALEVHPADALPADVIPNLRWIVPLLLDEEAMGGGYAVEVANAAGDVPP